MESTPTTDTRPPFNVGQLMNKVMLIKANTIRAAISESFEPFELAKFSGLNRLARRKVMADLVSMNFVTPWKANQIWNWTQFIQLIRLRVQLK